MRVCAVAGAVCALASAAASNDPGKHTVALSVDDLKNALPAEPVVRRPRRARAEHKFAIDDVYAAQTGDVALIEFLQAKPALAHIAPHEVAPAGVPSTHDFVALELYARCTAGEQVVDAEEIVNTAVSMLLDQAGGAPWARWIDTLVPVLMWRAHFGRVVEDVHVSCDAFWGDLARAAGRSAEEGVEVAARELRAGEYHVMDAMVVFALLRYGTRGAMPLEGFRAYTLRNHGPAGAFDYEAVVFSASHGRALDFMDWGSYYACRHFFDAHGRPVGEVDDLMERAVLTDDGLLDYGAFVRLAYFMRATGGRTYATVDELAAIGVPRDLCRAIADGSGRVSAVRYARRSLLADMEALF